MRSHVVFSCRLHCGERVYLWRQLGIDRARSLEVPSAQARREKVLECRNRPRDDVSDVEMGGGGLEDEIRGSISRRKNRVRSPESQT